MPERNPIQWSSTPPNDFGHSVAVEWQRDGSVRVMVSSGSFGMFSVIEASEIASLQKFLENAGYPIRPATPEGQKDT